MEKDREMGLKEKSGIQSVRGTGCIVAGSEIQRPMCKTQKEDSRNPGKAREEVYSASKHKAQPLPDIQQGNQGLSLRTTRSRILPTAIMSLDAITSQNL